MTSLPVANISQFVRITLSRWMPIRRQSIYINAVSLAFGQLGMVLAQSASLAVGARRAGLGQYGEWLLLSAIQTYLAMTDLGLVTGSVNAIQRHVERGENNAAISTMQRTLGALLIFCAIITIPLTALVILFRADFQHLFPHLGYRAVAWAIDLMLLDILSGFVAGLFVGVLRAYGKFAIAQTIFNASRVVQILVFTTLLWFRLPLVEAYGASLLSRLPILYGLARWSLLQSGWPLGSAVPILKLPDSDLRGESKGPLAVSVANVVHYQGLIIATSLLLGPAATVTVFTLRLITRFPTLLVNILGASLMPDLVKADAQQDLASFRSLMIKPLWIVGTIVLFTSLLLLLAGNSTLDFWSGSKLTLPFNGKIYALIDMMGVTISTYAAYFLIASGNSFRYGCITTAIYSTALLYLFLRPPHTTSGFLAAICLANFAVATASVLFIRRGWGSDNG